MQSWMFLSSFEKLRDIFLHIYVIDSMLHLGPRTFDELSGEVVQNTAFVLTKPRFSEYGMMTSFELASKPLEERKAIINKLIEEGDSGEFKKNIREAKGIYYRLVDGKNCADKEQMFLANKDGNEDGKHIYYPNVEQLNFSKIPGAPIGYWVTPKIQEIFTSNLALSAVASPCVGLQTADNARFLRLWFEPSYSRIGIGCENAALAARSQKKWFPYNKGGSFRRWYGNQEFVVNWEEDGKEIKEYKGAVIRNPTFYFKSSVSWGLIASNASSFRFYPSGFIYDVAGMSLFANDTNNQLFLLGSLNTKLAFKLVRLMNPTVNMQCGEIAKTPYLRLDSNQKMRSISDNVETNVSISHEDWDAHETSWDFQRNELLSIDADTYMENIDYKIEKHFEETGEHICIDPAAPQLGSLEWRMEQYKTKWEHKFMQLHKNEEELNRQFIDIYGLQDELTPDVPLNEITILQQGEISIE